MEHTYELNGKGFVSSKALSLYSSPSLLISLPLFILWHFGVLSWVMAINNPLLFEDIFAVKDIDQDGKKFERGEYRVALDPFPNPLYVAVE